MRGHEHEHVEAEDSLRPHGSRVDERHGVLMRAAAAGRTDVLGPDGLLRMQRVVGNSSTAGVARSPVLDVLSSGGGRPLDEPVREDMEGRFGASFADVRVHTDDSAHESAKSVSAHAYTVGSNIVFQRDRYDPSSDAGRTMLAHELTHVVQQRSGPVDGTPTGSGVSVSDPSDRFEREAVANADRLMSAPTVAHQSESAAAPGPSLSSPLAAPVQRDQAEEDSVQGSFESAPVAQREEEEEGDE